MGDMTLSMIIMIPCEMFWSTHLKIIRVINLLGIIRGRFDGHGYAI